MLVYNSRKGEDAGNPCLINFSVVSRKKVDSAGRWLIEILRCIAEVKQTRRCSKISRVLKSISIFHSKPHISFRHREEDDKPNRELDDVP